MLFSLLQSRSLLLKKYLTDLQIGFTVNLPHASASKHVGRQRAGRVACFALMAAFLLAPMAANAGYQEGLRLVKKGSWDQAIDEFLPLAEEGHAASQFSLGLIYQLGRGVPKNSEVARNYYIKAAKQNYWPAYNNLAKMYLDGDGVKRNRATAFQLFKKAAIEHAQARSNLARMYLNGWGTEKDVPKALDLYEQSGDDGYIPGYYSLGQIYEKGAYVPADEKTAIQWYARAAEKNHKPSVRRLEALGASDGFDSIESLDMK